MHSFVQRKVLVNRLTSEVDLGPGNNRQLLASSSYCFRVVSDNRRWTIRSQGIRLTLRSPLPALLAVPASHFPPLRWINWAATFGNPSSSLKVAKTRTAARP